MRQIKEKVEILDDLKPYLVLVLMAGLVILTSLYAFFISKAILDTSKMRGLATTISDLSTESSELESRYIAMKSGITLNVAYERGFKNSETPKFVAKRSLGARLTFNNEI